jgi:hypothetical protein
MSVKRKNGKGKYAYQARKAGVKSETLPADLKAAISDLAKTDKETKAVINVDNHIVGVKNNVAVMLVNIGKINLIYEMKRIGIIAFFIIALLVVLFIVLK